MRLSATLTTLKLCDPQLCAVQLVLFDGLLLLGFLLQLLLFILLSTNGPNLGSYVTQLTMTFLKLDTKGAPIGRQTFQRVAETVPESRHLRKFYIRSCFGFHRPRI